MCHLPSDKFLCFDAGQLTVVASTGFAMYLTRDAIAVMLRHIAALAKGSTLAMVFVSPRSPRLA
jgi:O-methyltransferase involved in polyketide biosynthesis